MFQHVLVSNKKTSNVTILVLRLGFMQVDLGLTNVPFHCMQITSAAVINQYEWIAPYHLGKNRVQSIFLI